MQKSKLKFKIKNLKKGFTLLLAVLVISIVSAMSFGFSAFIVKELNISAVGRESMKALFASDSGAECVFYWEFKGNAFATDSPSSTITCAGSTYNLTPQADWNSPNATTTFYLNFDNGACARVGINKKDHYPEIWIESYGRNSRNTGDLNCTGTSRDRVERALRIKF